MIKLQNLTKQIGIDGLLILIAGIVAIAIAIYDLIGGNQISSPVLVGILGLFLLEIILQRQRLDKAKEDIVSSLDGVFVERFSDDREFANAKYHLLLKTKKHILDMELCKPKVSTVSDNPRRESTFRQLLNQRVIDGEIAYKYVEVIYSRNQFEQLIYKLFRFYKYDYYIGCFIGAPEVIPVLNLMIFDDEHFLTGGYYGSSARGESKPLHIKHSLMGEAYSQYFDYLWIKSRLLNEKQGIHWDILHQCGLELGLAGAFECDTKSHK